MKINGKDLVSVTVGYKTLYSNLKVGYDVTVETSKVTITKGKITKIDPDAFWVNGIRMPFEFCIFHKV